ncbi:MAG: hypothetical protein JNL60_14250, partial [Bacteroidia bacterium]|nr:hypothetical protein [Bacteroidia bacterium]
MRLFSKLACIAILISSSRVFAQAVPADKSTLSYIDVYFETDFVKDAAQYELALYSDSLHAINDQAEKTLSGKLPAFYLKDLNWNSRYFWKIKTYNNRGELSNGGSIRSFRICQKVNYITFDEI